jgi:hypothetical protein
MNIMVSTSQILPPALIHQLRALSYPRLFRMTGNPGNRGFGRYLRTRIAHVVKREKTLIEKTISVAYLGSYLVDHLVNAERAACRIIERREMTEEEQRRMWERSYHDVMLQLTRELPEGEAILDEMARLERFTRLPTVIYRMRAVHWRVLEILLTQGTERLGGPLTETLLYQHIQRILAEPRSARAKAWSVCLVASLLADKECWLQHTPWPVSYSQIMTDLYPLLAQHPDVLEAIVNLP